MDIHATRRLLLILTLGLLLAAGYWLYQQWPQLTYQLIRWQMQFHRKLGGLLRASASLESGVIASLIATSFAYGVFHAAGPAVLLRVLDVGGMGHAKVLRIVRGYGEHMALQQPCQAE